MPKKTIAQARSYGIDNQDLRSARYLVAFHEGDRGAMKEEAGGIRDSADEFQMRGLQAAAAAFQGRLQEFRLYNRQAVDAARRSGMAQAALQFAAEGARTEALLGNASLALQQVKSLDAAGSWPDLLRNSITMLLAYEEFFAIWKSADPDLPILMSLKRRNHGSRQNSRRSTIGNRDRVAACRRPVYPLADFARSDRFTP